MYGLPNVQRIPKKEIFLEIKRANNFGYIKTILEKYRNNIAKPFPEYDKEVEDYI